MANKHLVKRENRGCEVFEKSQRKIWFPAFVCRATGGNGHPWAPGGARHEKLQEHVASEKVVGSRINHSGSQGRDRGLRWGTGKGPGFSNFLANNEVDLHGLRCSR